MTALLKLSGEYQNRWKVSTARHLTGLWIGLIGVALSLSACGLPGAQTCTPLPPLPTPTNTPLATASIEGILWHDLCVNDSTEAEPPLGCVIDNVTWEYIANGILEIGEPGIPDVRIGLGFGACPSIGLAEVKTKAEGAYTIEGLWPGEYCVSVILGGAHQLASMVTGIWTYPKDGMQTITLEHGELRSDVNFGWDYLNKPSLPEPTPEPSPPPTCVDSAQFIKDVTIPDGSRIEPGDAFTKIWRLRNNGDCTWMTDYDLVFYSGDRMSGYYVLPLRGKIEPGEIVDLSVELVAPKNAGTYWGYWMLRNAQSDLFGIGEDGSNPFWVKVLIDPKITEWRGEYYDNRKLEGDPALIRNDTEIDFDWKLKGPGSGLPADDFSAQWSRELRFNAGTYRFSVSVDDGARLWVDDRLVIDEWHDGSV
ncbi:MAG: NBR1-Ig-like domain-containing protein, partial [Anaerolineales bacterium]